jgi:hypothetical protein
VGYLIKSVVGLALFVGGIVLFNVKLVALLETGTCASGNTPYQIAQPCPEGTGTDMLLLTASIFAGLIGAGLFAFRGDPPWGSGKGRMTGMFGFGTFAWGIFFSSTGAVCLAKALTDDSLSAGSDLGAKIVGITFLVMGLPALAIALWGLVQGIFSPRDERPAAATAGGAATGGIGGVGGMMSRMTAGLGQARAAQQLGARMPWGPGGGGGKKSSGDAIGKLERLQKLRESGAINDKEFEREKAKILAEG